jgi:hypothetical protein
MSNPNGDSLLPVPTSQDLETSISSFNQPLAGYIASVGLPTENILAPIDERKKVLGGLASALAVLPLDERARAYYLTKFTVAITVGLFDGALNYLWNETVNALRAMVARFDLGYFFSVAEKVNSRYRNFDKAEDLAEVNDHDLLEVCRRIGLINDVNYKRLEYVNYMRNHVSAAHPNDNEIDGFEMLSWLSNCIKYAITAKPDHSVVTVQMLLDNIRNKVIPADDFIVIGEDIARLPQERIDDLLWTIFGLYADPKQSSTTKDNITGLAEYVWNASTEDRRFEIGARFGMFRKNADIPRKDATQEFLTIVKGLSYKDEDSLAGELIEKLEALKSVHFAPNNFYNEYPHARALAQSLPRTGIVPRPARSLWVKVVCVCYIGNGFGYREGVDQGALPYYKQYIASFTEAEVAQFLVLMSDPEFTESFSRSMAEKRARSLAEELKSKTANVHMLRALDIIIKAPAGRVDVIASTTDYKDAMKYVPKFK